MSNAGDNAIGKLVSHLDDLDRICADGVRSGFFEGPFGDLFVATGELVYFGDDPGSNMLTSALWCQPYAREKIYTESEQLFILKYVHLNIQTRKGRWT